MNINQESMNIGKSNKTWGTLAALILAISILRGIRYPGTWAYTHFLFNYSFGFVKRSFVGGALNYLGSPYLKTYDFFFIASLLVLSVNILLIYLLMLDLIKTTDTVSTLSALVFASSPAIIFIAHTGGYFDQLGLLTALISLRIKGLVQKILFLIPAFSVALLAHEANLVLFFPVIFISLLYAAAWTRNVKNWGLIGSFTLITVSLGIFAGSAVLEKKSVEKLYQNLQVQVENPSLIRRDAFEPLYSPTDKNITELHKMWSNKNLLGNILNSFSVILPTMILLNYSLIHLLKRSNVPGWLLWLSVLACWSPLILHFLAWDMDRWNTAAITASFLVLCSVRANVKEDAPQPDPPRYIWPAALFLLFFNGASQINLFDGYVVQQFPFREHQAYIFSIVVQIIRAFK